MHQKHCLLLLYYGKKLFMAIHNCSCSHAEIILRNAHAYQTVLKQHGICVSMSRKGNCWANAVMGRFFGTLKRECTSRALFTPHEQARTLLLRFSIANVCKPGLQALPLVFRCSCFIPERRPVHTAVVLPQVHRRFYVSSKPLPKTTLPGVCSSLSRRKVSCKMLIAAFKSRSA